MTAVVAKFLVSKMASLKHWQVINRQVGGERRAERLTQLATSESRLRTQDSRFIQCFSFFTVIRSSDASVVRGYAGTYSTEQYGAVRYSSDDLTSDLSIFSLSLSALLDVHHASALLQCCSCILTQYRLRPLTGHLNVR